MANPLNFVLAAQQLAEGICRQGLPPHEGVSWSSRASNHHFYDGSIGVSVFLAAVAKITGLDYFRDAAFSTLKPLQRLVRGIAKAHLPSKVSWKLGSLIGIGSLIYGFTKASQLLNSEILLEDACSAAELLTDERVVADPYLDVAHGSAGALLALLALRRHLTSIGSKPVNVSRLEICAENLLNQRIADQAGLRAWYFDRKRAICGLSHGASGIGLALVALFREIERPELLESALEGFAFERLYLDTQHGNWRDLRYSDPRFTSSWCHGAPGIALSRMATLSATRDIQVQKDLEVALASTSRLDLDPVDHLCCGNFGRVEVLCSAGRLLGRPDLERKGVKLAGLVLKERGCLTNLMWDLGHPQLFKPALFTGAAGVGYTLLRLACPEELPCLVDFS